MKVFKDKKVIIFFSILLIFTVIYFITVIKMSHAFETDYDANEVYNLKIKTIRESAAVYAEKNPDLFKDGEVVYIKVQDLIDNNLLVTNSDGTITNPLNTKEYLNSNIIKLKQNDGNILIEVDI